METLVAVAIFLNALVFVALAVGAGAGLRMMKRIQEDVNATLREATATLSRAEKLAEATENMVRFELSPTLAISRAALAHVEVTTRGISEGVQGVRNMVGQVEKVASPSSLLSVVSSVLGLPTGKAGLIALGLGAGIRAVVHSRNSKSASKPKQAAEKTAARSRE